MFALPRWARRRPRPLVAGKALPSRRVPWYEISLSGTILKFLNPPSTQTDAELYAFSFYQDERPFINLKIADCYMFSEPKRAGIRRVHTSVWQVVADRGDAEPIGKLRLMVDLLTPSRFDYRHYDNLFSPALAKRWLQTYYRQRWELRNSVRAAVLTSGDIMLDLDPQAGEGDIVADDDPVPVEDIRLAGRAAFAVATGTHSRHILIAVGRRDMLRFSLRFDPDEFADGPAGSADISTLQTIADSIMSSVSIELAEDQREFYAPFDNLPPDALPLA